MADDLGVSLDVLTQTTKDIREQKSIMSEKLKDISDTVVKINWKSPASELLKSIASQMDERFTELNKDVESFAVFLDKVTNNYDINEKRQKERLSALLSAYNH